jgi:SAM-dependent methyltransferase
MKDSNSTDHWNTKWVTTEPQYVLDHNVMYAEVRPYMKGDIIDLGCGNGYIGHDIGDRYSGIDHSEEGIKKAREYNPQGTFHVGDMRDTPFEDRSADTVLLTAVVEHFSNYKPVLWEAKRICRGRIVAILPYQSRGPEHYHPHWPIEKAVDAFRDIGEIVEYRQISHDKGKWVLVVVEIV